MWDLTWPKGKFTFVQNYKNLCPKDFKFWKCAKKCYLIRELFVVVLYSTKRRWFKFVFPYLFYSKFGLLDPVEGLKTHYQATHHLTCSLHNRVQRQCRNFKEYYKLFRMKTAIFSFLFLKMKSKTKRCLSLPSFVQSLESESWQSIFMTSYFSSYLWNKKNEFSLVC